MSEIAAIRSNCSARRVGAVLTKNNRVIATGYNGTPSKIKNCNEGGCKRCKDRLAGNVKSGESLNTCLCMHAEANAILHCSLAGIKTPDSTLYVTVTPCIECAKLLITAGIKRIVCHGKYSEDSSALLKESKIKVEYYESDMLYRWLDMLTTKN